ncbi:MAG TPA: hypothetical protein VGQ68_01940 [Gaiellaceae bacterium]|jgi:hypothetical protein|nr:hypothetical protein [Gaiellaceae bacterium]
MLERGALVEHGSSRTGRWLRARRVRVAFWIAVIEGVLVVFHVISWPIALIVAIAVVGLYFWAGARISSATVQEIAWIAAVSQALVALVPVLLIFVTTLALIAVGILAVIALVLLFSNRR